MYYNLSTKKNNLHFVSAIASLLIFSVVYVSVCLFAEPETMAVSSSEFSQENRAVTVIIDPGHGGIDSGAVSQNGILEKDINFKISSYLKNFLELSNVNCFMTRSDDNLLVSPSVGSKHFKRGDLIARRDIANNCDNGIFISIHQNKFTNSRYFGLQVFYSKNNSESIELAKIIKDSNRSLLCGDNNREIKPAGSEIYLLDNIDIPAVLVECGFLSNHAEASKLNSDNYQRELAFMLYSSVIKYINDSQACL